MEINGNVNRVFVSSDSPTGHFPWLPHCRWDIPGVSSKCCRVTSVNRAGDRTAMPEDAAWIRLLWQALRWLSSASKDSCSARRSARRGVSPKQSLQWQPLKELTKEPGPKYREEISAQRSWSKSSPIWCRQSDGRVWFFFKLFFPHLTVYKSVVKLNKKLY